MPLDGRIPPFARRRSPPPGDCCRAPAHSRWGLVPSSRSQIATPGHAKIYPAPRRSRAPSSRAAREVTFDHHQPFRYIHRAGELRPLDRDRSLWAEDDGPRALQSCPDVNRKGAETRWPIRCVMAPSRWPATIGIIATSALPFRRMRCPTAARKTFPQFASPPEHRCPRRQALVRLPVPGAVAGALPLVQRQVLV